MKESDIRPDQFVKKINYYAKQDKKILIKNKSQFIYVTCPACGKKDSVNLFENNGINYQKCRNCSTVFVNPRPSEDLLKIYYKNSKNYAFWNKYVFPASEKVRREQIFKPRVELLLQYIKKFNIETNCLMEVGSGFGTFCEELKKTKQFNKIIAVEPTPDLAQTCRNRDLDVLEKPIEDIANIDNINVIATFETIEHLFNPKKFLIKCVNLLTKNGILFLTCPNINGFETLMLGKKSVNLGGEHLNMFNPDSIKILVEKCNLKVLEIVTPGKLDAEIVRKAVLANKLNLENQPFLKHILIDKWKELGDSFQEFLATNQLSSHMLVIAIKN
jgi:uncharacterized metal-binding protein (TIGR02443 family)